MKPSLQRTNYIRQACVRWMKKHAIHNYHKIVGEAEKKHPITSGYESQSLNLKAAWKKGGPACSNLKVASRVHISIDQP